MTYIISHPGIAHSYDLPVQRRSIWLKFMDWATLQEETNHIGWVGASIMLMAGMFFPATMLFALQNGASFGLIIPAMVALVAVVAVNLAAMPTRYSIPVLFFSILIDLGVIGLSLFL